MTVLILVYVVFFFFFFFEIVNLLEDAGRTPAQNELFIVFGGPRTCFLVFAGGL